MSDPITGLAHMLGQPFIQHALVAGTSIALLSGLVGYFVVLRGQVFAGDALSHVAYAGALAALAAGVDLRFGLFAATIAVGLVLGLLGGRRAADDVVIGTAFAWVLGLGVFFLAIYTTHSATGNSAANVNVLFGSILGISASAASTAAWIAVGLIALLLVLARPLLFASLDPDVARASGVPVRLLGPLFLAIVGATAAEASQAIGALLLFGLLAAPPAAAQRLTDRPWRGFVLSGLLSVLCLWIGVCVAYAAPKLPVSFTIMTTSTVLYAGVVLVTTVRWPAFSRRGGAARP
ncbi:iron chelate uptake ABC transporter family permease subunit [Jatrophihabitans sp.]|uniref:metal ABC transporter permease n=1 Tax=Jatrophihabitans sp. TaxID=1932789 RepID=UPI0030C6AF4D|nr:metal transporter permease [Jatrophihabitans sp.]